MSTSSETSVDGPKWYVYALVDPLVLKQTGSQLLSVFYVGKGSKDRAEFHEKDELKALLTNEKIQMEGSKNERIDNILGSGERINSIVLANGFVDENDTHAAEALAMELIGRLLSAHEMQPLTNIAPGHGQSKGMEVSGDGTPINEPLLFGSATAEVGSVHEPEFEWRSVQESLRLSTSRPIEMSEVIEEKTILVKGTRDSLESGSHKPDTSLPGSHQIKPMLWEFIPGTEFTRRAYDPVYPWNDHEARERARRYWPINEQTVLAWIDDPSTCPTTLLLAIPGSGGTTVRYAWKIDPAGQWERFREGYPRWGVPLGESDLEHPARGACLVEDRKGKTTQVLANYSSGIRVLDPEDWH